MRVEIIRDGLEYKVFRYILEVDVLVRGMDIWELLVFF